MLRARKILCSLIAGVLVVSTGMAAGPDDKRGAARRAAPVVVIGHRGASGYVPEHTLTSYFIAIQQGADYVEPDLVVTKDGVLIARHENEIGGTTDVAAHPQFAARKTSKTIDGVTVSGWFTEDFTLAELKTLRAKERIADLRRDNVRFDGQFEIPTLDEVLALVQAVDKQRAQAAEKRGLPKPAPIGVYPETKHPTYFSRLGLAMEELLVRTLERHGYSGKRAPVFIQSFEVGNLKSLSKLTGLPLVQLIESGGQPYDFVAAGDPRGYAELVTPQGLAGIASYAQAIGVHKDLIVPRTSEGMLRAPTTLVADAHAAGLDVHAWTFRAENNFLPGNFRRGDQPGVRGDLVAEIETFLATGLDGFFTDHPDLGVRARDAQRRFRESQH
jgi:glycerophosphoryl diester phosphodiesterase